MRVRVIGLGEIGLRVAANAVKRKHEVHGIDSNPDRLAQAARSSTQPEAALLASAGAQFSFATAVERGRFDLSIVCVPTYDARTGLRADTVAEVAGQLGAVITSGEVVAIESTVPIGSTESVVRERLETASGMRAGRNFFLVSSPERIDTALGRDVWSIARVLGGVTRACTAAGLLRYRELVREVVPVSSARTAEATKILENAYRLVNVAFVNEVSELFGALGLDAHEIVAAAATKPFGFAPFWPSVAAGGHCVPAAARALLAAAGEGGLPQTVIASSLRVNDAGADRIERLLGEYARGRVLVAGLTYKSDSDQFAQSRAVVVVEDLHRRGIDVTAADVTRPPALDRDVPFVPYAALGGRYDAVVVAAWSPAAANALAHVARETTLFLAGSALPAALAGEEHANVSLAVVG
jgi:UDP-N-acetyl-D-glucosamine dehydrogenase